MPRHLALVFALALSSAAFAQSPTQPADTSVKHYRLTFLIDSGNGESGKQTFMLDVPVTASQMGAAEISLISGSKGDAQSIVRQLFDCTDVHATPTGLGLHIAMQSDREAPAIPGLVSARHQHGDFQQTVDLALNTPTVVTKPLQFRPLGNTDPTLAEKLRQPAPTITVTAEAL